MYKISLLFGLLVYMLPFIASAQTTALETFQDCTDCPEMITLPAGSFIMGSDVGSRDEKPAHTVKIEKPFAVGKYEVTKQEYAAFVLGANYPANDDCWIYTSGEWKKQNGSSWKQTDFDQTPSDPVVCVNWHDAKAYVKWLSQKTGKTYRLLSEAEWEYSARANMKSEFICGALDDCAEQVAWYVVNSKQRTHPVGQKLPNAFGLYDMRGNVLEWVADCYTRNYKTATPDTTAKDVENCKRRVMRGAAWDDSSKNLRAANRERYLSTSRNDEFGFRVARDIP